MSERGLSYSEACREVGRHGAQRRKAMRQRNAGGWIPAKPVDPQPINVRPMYPKPSEEHHLEQAFLDFN